MGSQKTCVVIESSAKMSSKTFQKESGNKCEATEVGSGNNKHCDISDKPADFKKYKWGYAGDKHDMDHVQGTVVHNRQWEYAMLDYYSLLKVMVDFKAQCTFAIKGAKAARKLRIFDDDGTLHGEIQLNIHAGTPCVCATASEIEVKKCKKTIRCPEPFNKKLTVGDCRTRTRTSSTSSPSSSSSKSSSSSSSTTSLPSSVTSSLSSPTSTFRSLSTVGASGIIQVPEEKKSTAEAEFKKEVKKLERQLEKKYR